MTQASIARIGANVLTEPAAPSTYQPPDIPDPQPSGSGSGRGRTGPGKLHRRTASIDAVAASADPSSHEKQERSSSVTRDSTYTQRRCHIDCNITQIVYHSNQSVQLISYA